MVNPERGEVSVTINGVEITLAPEMARLSAVQHSTGKTPLGELIRLIDGLESSTMMICLQHFALNTDKKELVDCIQTIPDLQELKPALLDVILKLNGEPSKNAQSGTEKG